MIKDHHFPYFLMEVDFLNAYDEDLIKNRVISIYKTI